jgi:precorrin-6A/cobalt-precorrin-6A reductase
MILILGGTAEARELAAHLDARGVAVTSSLAGRVARPRLPAGKTRIGGFGGPEALARWIVEHGVGGVVDATHPFAERISASAAAACPRAGVALLRLERPGWRERPRDRWRWVDDLDAAAAAIGRHDVAAPLRPPGEAGCAAGVPLAGDAGAAARLPLAGDAGAAAGLPHAGGVRPADPASPANAGASAAAGSPPAGDVRPADPAALAGVAGRRVLLTTGRQGLAAFAGIDDAWFLVRCVDPPSAPLPMHHEVLLDRGPYTLEGELALIDAYGIDVVVTKDSGGEHTVAKLDAARDRGLPVVVVRRPPRLDVPTVTTVGSALAWALAAAGTCP